MTQNAQAAPPPLFLFRKELEAAIARSFSPNARVGDTGFGMGQADVEVTWQGRRYAITIKERAESSAELLSRLGDDASKWALEFCRITQQNGHNPPPADVMVGWFANAIEHSDVVRTARREAAKRNDAQQCGRMYETHVWKGPNVWKGPHVEPLLQKPITDRAELGPGVLSSRVDDGPDILAAEAEARETESLAHKVETLWLEYTCTDSPHAAIRAVRKELEGERIERNQFQNIVQPALDRLIELVRPLAQGLADVRELNRATNERIEREIAGVVTEWRSLNQRIGSVEEQVKAILAADRIAGNAATRGHAGKDRTPVQRLQEAAAVEHPAQRIPGIHTDP